MADNRIQTLTADQVPSTLTRLDLLHNQLTSLPDLSHLPLHWLDVGYNSLTEVRGEYLSVSLRVLLLRASRISVMPDLSHLVRLEYAAFDGNKFHSLGDNQLPKHCFEEEPATVNCLH